MEFKLSEIQRHVQHNCHISDASHAGNYTLCIYLLKMREYFRWEREMSFEDSIDNELIGNWLTERESYWETLEESPFKNISIVDKRFEPFDIYGINKAIEKENLIYSAGYILRGKPHFFLADIIQTHKHDGIRIVISGKEHARELSAPPALSQGSTIFIRSESLRRTVWEKVEEGQWNKGQSPLVRAIACYDFENDRETSLNQLCDSEIKTLLAHEIGEIMAGKQLGDNWQKMVSQTNHAPLELMLRSIRDNLADCMNTLPEMIDDMEPARLHFYIANIGNMRKALFPALRDAYDRWLTDDSAVHFEKIVQRGKRHWLSLAEDLQDLFMKEGKIDHKLFQDTIESRTL